MKHKPSILFLGILYRDDDIPWFDRCSYTGLQAAANKFQWNFIEGLEKNYNSSVDIISTLSIGSYPLNSNKLFIKTKKTKINQDGILIQLGFVNFYVLKGLCRFVLLLISLKRWVKKNPDGGTIYVYSLYTPYLWALSFFKRILSKKEIKYCLIIPDLPGKYGMLEPLYSINGVYKRIDYFFVKKLYRYADFFVLLTNEMAGPLKIQNKPYVVIEGIISASQVKLYDQITSKNESISNTKIILYTGSLLNDFGIEELLKAFSRIEDSNYELWFCGPKSEAKTVLAYSADDRRIKYLGFLSKEEIARLQTVATILINPRPNIGEYVKYSFPSKTMEYLLSGTPLLMYKLSGMPADYHKHIYFIDKYDSESIAKAIMEICNKKRDELNSFAAKARSFVITNKSSVIQTKKIIELIDGLNSKQMKR